ncbi:MAG: hypothetical protein ABH871_01650 [Pseudomonadota bacterium]
MFAGGTTGSETPVGQQTTVEQSMDRWVQLVEQKAPFEDIQKAEQEVAEAMRRQPFEMRQKLPFFLDRLKKLSVHARTVFQHFRLPGRERVVHDRREQFEGKPEKAAKEVSKEAAKEAAKKEGGEEAKKLATFELKEGKLIKERGVTSAGVRATDVRAAEKRVDEMLSKFEKMIVARFEKGVQIAQQTKDGKPIFNPKTDAEWKQFFQNFMHRAVPKKALLDDIAQFFMRGVMAKGGKGIFIGDMALNSGRVEKFVRFSILAEALAKFRAMMPGSAVSKAMLGKLSGEELMYLALAASRREFATSMRPTQGKFAGARAEAQAAAALGIPLQTQLEKKARHLRGRHAGAGFGWYEKDREPEEMPYQFVPWWSWGNLNNPGPTRWVTRAFYGALLIISLIGIAVLTIRLLGGG